LPGLRLEHKELDLKQPNLMLHQPKTLKVSF
jgi:hypothetical protein